MNNEYSFSAEKSCRRAIYPPLLACMVLFLSAACVNAAGEKSSDALNTNRLGDSNRPAKSAADAVTELPHTIIKNSKEGLDNVSETGGYLVELAQSNTENWPQRIIRDTKESFLRPDNLSLLLLAGGASVALHSSHADNKVADNFEDHHSFHGFTDEGLNVAGHPWTHIGVAALWYADSRRNKNDFNAERAKSMLAALSVTGVTTFGLKAIRHNDSPNGKDWAWPSGHAASSFTVASMLDEFYGPNVGVPAYLCASLISYRMLDTGDHWTSDVVFGVAIGWVVGHTFGEKHRQLEIAGFKVLPYTATYDRGSVVGVNLIKRF
jgi:hypothetical protein